MKIVSTIVRRKSPAMKTVTNLARRFNCDVDDGDEDDDDGEDDDDDDDAVGKQTVPTGDTVTALTPESVMGQMSRHCSIFAHF